MPPRSTKSSQKTVSQEYLDGIREGREILRSCGDSDAETCLANAQELCKRYAANSPLGQMARGERDFWLNHIRNAKLKRR